MTILGTGGYEALKALLSRRNDSNFELKLGYRRKPDGADEKWVEIRGSGSEIAEVLGQINPWRSERQLEPGHEDDES